LVSVDDRLAALRSALFVGDGRRAVDVLSIEVWPDLLQIAGDGLLVACKQQVEGAAELARRCAGELRDRDWAGDEELANQLDAALGDRPAPMLRPLAVDLEQLADILEGDPIHGGGQIDLRTGEVWPQAAMDYASGIGKLGEEDLDDPDRWLAVSCEGSRDAYRDMEYFIGTLADEDRADRLSIAIEGGGAFRRFKDVLEGWPGELARWYVFSGERQRGRARDWLADAGYSSRRPEPHLST
jgi:hypothetical protein